MASFDRRSTAEHVSAGVDLSGRHAIVTGASAGIGVETARVLALRGSSVTMACRDLGKAEGARRRILDASPGAIDPKRLEVRELDLASLASVRAFASGFLATGRPLHLLINNAGVVLASREETEDGFEAHFGINHLGHFLLTNLLRGALEAAAPSRVVCVSSDAARFASLSDRFHDLNWEERRFSGMRAYGDSKLMNIMFAAELTLRLQGSGVVANAVHPGLIETELGRNLPWWGRIVGQLMRPFSKTVPQGAATSVYVATAGEYADRGGLYFADCRLKPAPSLAGHPDACATLWDLSEKQTGLRWGRLTS